VYDRQAERKAPIVKVDAEKPDEKGIRETVQIIRQGGVVAYPTESFYGLGVDPSGEKAVERLFQIKRRQREQPILVLIPSIETLDFLVRRVPAAARILMHAFWPGGLTLVFDASDRVPRTITGGTGKIGIRVSSHPIAASLVGAVGGPITSTSANVTGKQPCRTAHEVARQLGRQVDVILDGGTTPGKSASTVLDVTMEPPAILREGMISRAQIEQVAPLRSHPHSCVSEPSLS
jgi:L-threonylcarbamoyladenylate synthase